MIFPNDQPCVAWLAPSSLNSTTGPSAADTSHPDPKRSLGRYKQHQQDDALLHHLTGRDPKSS